MKKPNNFSCYTTLGLNMVVGMGVFTYAGYWIDQKRGGGEVATLIGMFLGLFYCGYEVWKLMRIDNEK